MSSDDKIRERAFGIIGFRLIGGDGAPQLPEYLLINQKCRSGDFWGIPKGHAEPRDKSEKQSAMREFCEETGIAAEKMTPWFHVDPFSQTYYVKGWLQDNKLKEVKYWLAKLEGNVDIKVQDSEVNEAKWLSFDAAYKQLEFPSLKTILAQAYERVLAEIAAAGRVD